MRRCALFVIIALSGCVGGSNDTNEELIVASQALTADQARVLGFETPLQDWSSQQGTLSASSIVSQGAAALGVTSVGWTEIPSRTLSSLGTVGGTLSYDIRVPQVPVWGETRMVVQIPSRGIFWLELGSFSLAGSPAGVFRHVSFVMPSSLVTALNGTYSDLVFRLVINGPALGAPYLVDNLSVGAGTAPGTGGTPGTGGSTGVGGAPGAGGTVGFLEFSVQTPDPNPPAAMVLTAASSLLLNDRVTVGPTDGSVVTASFGGAQIAAGGRVNGSLYDVGNLFMGSGSRITRTLTITGAVTRQDGVQIGTETHVASIPATAVRFRVPVPAAAGDVALGPDTTRTLAAGAYGRLDVQSRAELTLHSGIYIFSSFNVEPQGRIVLVKNEGPIQIYVTGAPFQFKGELVNNAGPLGDLLVGYLGTADAYVQGPFLGTLLAPNAEIALHRPTNDAAHQGAFFGLRVQVFSNATVLHVPFRWTVLGFPPVGPGDVPSPTPPPSSTDNTCQADFNATINFSVDANGDGFPDIVQITPRPTVPGCPAPRFCRRVVLPDGSEQFVPVPPTPVLDPALPVPLGAISTGCSAEPAAPVCPILGSTGLRALGCDAEPADPSCLTVTMCPDPGTFEDPNNPDVRRVFDGVSADALPGAVPPGAVDAVAGEIRQILEELSPLYINPCEWDPVLDQFTFPVDIKGAGKTGGADCSQGSECQSGVCEDILTGTCQGSNSPCDRNSQCGAGGNCVPFGFCQGSALPCQTTADCGGTACFVLATVFQCAPGTSPVRLNIDEGSSSWNVKFNGGVAEGRAVGRRVVFFPSAEFDVAVDSDAHLTATAFGNQFNLFQLNITSHINECGFNFDWNSRTGDDDFQVVDGLIRENLGVGAFVPGNVAAIQAASDPNATATCQTRLADLHQAEKRANEAFHDALIASTFYNLAGPNGTVVQSRAVAQGFIDSYVTAAGQYQTAVAAYNPAQQAALDHLVAGKVLDFEFNVEFSFVHGVGIGPFNPGIEVGIYGRAGLDDVTMENRANTHFTNSALTPCAGDECFDLGVKGGATPKAAVGLFAFIGGGVNLVVAGGRVGIRGELDLANFKLPLAAEFAVQRTTLPAQAMLTAIPALPPSLVPILTSTANLLVPSLFEVPPLVAQFNAPYAIGSNLQSLEGPTVEGQFLSGRVKLWAKAWFLFVTKKWEKTLFSWNGIKRSWHVGDPLSGDLVAPIVHDIGFAAVPNMVLLPKLALVPTPGTADPTATSAAINTAFDTQIIKLGPLQIPFDAHEEPDLGRPWLPSTSSGRCEIFTPPPPP